MRTLRELNARLYKIESPGSNVCIPVDRLEDAQCVMFLCPKCFDKNLGPIGTHSVMCWFLDRGVPDSETPGPGRWTPQGTGIDDLTFVGPSAASVLLLGGDGVGCGWHGFIRNGQAVDA